MRRSWRSGRADEGDGLENRCTESLTDCSADTYDPSSVELGVLLGVLERECPELAAIVAVWADLPEHIRQAVITLVEAAIQSEDAKR